MDKIGDPIREQVLSLAREQGYDGEIADDASLILSGLLDSFAVLRLVVFMEKTFGINFADEHFDQNIFDTIAGMTAFVIARCVFQ
jgi:acyl carrier protein